MVNRKLVFLDISRLVGVLVSLSALSANVFPSYSDLSEIDPDLELKLSNGAVRYRGGAMLVS